ncbi:heat stress transcription factor B-2a-like, partial [Helianthus annuus]|uniref:heat stress transcription factor B-2a-like n=1 Tax=Helianthus annuus TaxID=4232 RepID=UPI001652F2FF
SDAELIGENERLRRENLQLNKELSQMKQLCNSICVMMSNYATNTTTSPSDSTTIKPLELLLLKRSSEDSGRGGSGITGEFINPRLFSVPIGMKRVREDDGDAAELRLEPPGDGVKLELSDGSVKWSGVDLK